MEARDAIRVLAQEIAATRFPIKRNTRGEFEQLVSAAKENYRRYCSFTEEVEVDGEQVEVEFHLVGHNASHEFSIAMLPDGRFVKHCVGEGADWDEETDSPKIETSIYVKDDVGYMGHW